MTWSMQTELESATKKDEVPIKGFNECCEYLKAFASNGIVMNSFLLWVSIKRLTTAEDTWKEESIARFLPEEITAAKESLWHVSADKIPNPLKKRQGKNKIASEVNDISTAMTQLAEKECLPMFLSTNDMIKETPLLDSDTMQSYKEKETEKRLGEIEKCVRTLLSEQTEIKKMVSEFPQNGTQNENQESETKAKPSSSIFTWAGESDIIMSDSTDE